nr:reverse transcriptase domain-containing protein [Tanacetum cinerariifolium]
NRANIDNTSKLAVNSAKLRASAISNILPRISFKRKSLSTLGTPDIKINRANIDNTSKLAVNSAKLRASAISNILPRISFKHDEPMWAADHVVAPTFGSVITIPETAKEFDIKGNHLTLVKGDQFDGRTKTDPHKHIYEFLRICDMLKYKDTENEAVSL